jgi:hypothetical protein
MTDALHTVDVREYQSGLLRFALKFDAVASGMMGLLLLAGGSMLADLLGMPADLLVPLGLFLAAYAVSIWLIGTQRNINRTAAWAVVGLNLVWVIESVAVVIFGWFPLTALGVAFVLAQAVAVLVFADLQYLGLRRSRPAIA